LYSHAEAKAAATGTSLTSATSIIGQLPATGSKITSDELEKVSLFMCDTFLKLIYSFVQIKAELMKNAKQTSSIIAAEIEQKASKEKQSRISKSLF
jgi:hypothetical protein